MTEYYSIKPCFAASVRWVTHVGGDELKSQRLCGYEQRRRGS